MEGRTKKERREATQRERQRIVKEQARRRRLWQLGLAGAIGVGVLVVIALLVVNPGSSSDSSTESPLPGIQTGPPPWPPELADLRERLRILGLPASSQMSATLHNHDLLQILDHGKPVPVPASIGINQTAGFLTSLHTHDDSGIIHVESPTVRDFNLGEFFDVWGVRLTSTCVGGLCDAGQNQLHAYVDGKSWSGDPRAIPLKQHEDIVLTYGTQAEQPNRIPSNYSKKISDTCSPDC
ncbi:MAG: hypothetical protein ACJ758_05420 [Actinomycetota bacterium]